MFKINNKIIPVLFLSAVGLTAAAQKSVVAAGGMATGAGGSVSFSIGQLDYVGFSNAGGSVTQGVQQSVASSVLPVTLLNFAATKVDQIALLNWQTATELNTSKFLVERSHNGLNFLPLSQVSAAGTSTSIKSYSAEDPQPLQGWNYYRIKLYDKDGSFIYSKIQPLNFDWKSGFAVVYPNPAKSIISIKFTSGINQRYTYKLHDTKGALMMTGTISDNQTNINIQKLANGTYSLTLVNQDNISIKTIQIVKN